MERWGRKETEKSSVFLDVPPWNCVRVPTHRDGVPGDEDQRNETRHIRPPTQTISFNEVYLAIMSFVIAVDVH